MCLTTHFIDDNWRLQKRILNFCQVEEHKGETIGKKIESSLLEWNVDGIFTLTVDNASSNNLTIKFLKRKTVDWKRTVLKNEFLHMRCYAHILNLIVDDRLKKMNESIVRVCDVVRFVRSSPQRLGIFKHCAEKEKISTKQLVCLDVPTRWNSTYMMLESAENFERAFQRMAEEDTSFRTFFNVKDGGEDEEEWIHEALADVEVGEGGRSGVHKVYRLPTKLDWKNCRTFVTFLKLFYVATKRFSAFLFVTSNCFFDEVYGIETYIDHLITNKDSLMASMAMKMKAKLEKYWGDGDKINPPLYVAVALDPRLKLRWVKFVITESKGKAAGEAMEKRVTEIMRRLYDAYANAGEVRVEAPRAMPSAVMNDDCNDPRLSLASRFNTFLEDECASECESEVEKYLIHPCEPRKAEEKDKEEEFDTPSVPICLSLLGK